MPQHHPIVWMRPVAYLFILFVLVPCLKPAWRWLQRKRSTSWPTTDGHIESASAIPANRAFNSGQADPFAYQEPFATPHIAELSYSYFIAGNFEAGWYRRDFPSEEEALDFVRGLKGKAICSPLQSRQTLRFFAVGIGPRYPDSQPWSNKRLLAGGEAYLR